MTDTPAKAFEEKLITIDLIDSLRREQERLDLALGDAEQMKTLRKQIQAYYQKAGITVSDALIDQAIAERQAQRNTFKPNKLSAFGRTVATGYIYRRRIGLIVVVLAAVTVLAWFAHHQIKNWQAERELRAYRYTLQQKLDLLNSLTQLAASLPAELAILESADVPALPQWSEQLRTEFSKTRLALTGIDSCTRLSLPVNLVKPWPGEPELISCAGQNKAVQAAIKQAQKLQHEHQQLASTVETYTLLLKRAASMPELKKWRAVTAALAAAGTSAMPGSTPKQFAETTAVAVTAIDDLAKIAGLHSRGTVCLQDAMAHAKANDKTALKDLLNIGLAYRDADRLDGINDWSVMAEQTCGFFKTPITLRIVSEPGVKTGVWRYYGSNKDAISYYLIVDALSGGVPVEALIKSVEDQKDYAPRRFGVRVEKSIYEAVKRDKQDDGLIEKPEAGQKPANSLRWQLPSGYEDKFIVKW